MRFNWLGRLFWLDFFWRRWLRQIRKHQFARIHAIWTHGFTLLEPLPRPLRLLALRSALGPSRLPLPPLSRETPCLHKEATFIVSAGSPTISLLQTLTNTALGPIRGCRSPRFRHRVAGFSASSDGTYIYILGGVDQNFTTTATLWRYDPISNTYNTNLPDYTIPTYFHATAYLNGKTYRVAGRERSRTGQSPLP